MVQIKLLMLRELNQFAQVLQQLTSQVAHLVKNLPANTGDLKDTGSIPGWGRSLGGGHGNLLQYSCLENSMDRGAWWTTVHGVTQSRTRLKRKEDPGRIQGEDGCLHGKERGL